MVKTLNLEWQVRELTPTLLIGKDAKKMYDILPEQARVGLKYNEVSKSVIGSTPLASVVLDVEAQKYGARTPNLRDLSRPEVIEIAKNKFYIDSRNLIIRSNTDPDYPKNDSLLKQIYELAEQKEGKVKNGFMIEGFTFVPDENDKIGYGLKILPQSDFKVTQDSRLIGHNGDSFSEVDELGLPLFNKKGNRNWYAKDKGLSRLCLFSGLDLYAGDDYLANSSSSGRVVFLR